MHVQVPNNRTVAHGFEREKSGPTGFDLNPKPTHLNPKLDPVDQLAGAMRNLTLEESNARQKFKEAMDDKRYFEAFKYRELLAKAYKKKQLDEELEHLFRLNEQQQKAFNHHVKDKDKHAGNLAKEAEARRMGESACERLATLARFDQQALAFLMLTKDIKFILKVIWISTGAQLAVGTDYPQFMHLKETNPDLVFDHDDYPFPLGKDAESIRVRAETREKLLARNIFMYKLAPDGNSYELVGQAITDPRLITVEVLMANKIVPKPDVMLQLRKEATLFTVEMAGVAGDIIKLLEEYDPSQKAGQKRKRENGQSDAEQQAIMQRQAARMRPSS